MAEQDAWVIRAYQPGDEAELAELFGQVFHRPLTTAHWLWKLKGTPSPVENVWLAVHEDVPIFQYAGIPMRFVLDGRAVTGMVSVDTMTAPEFQRRGLLTQVGSYTYARWREAGISFILGLPNERWGSRTNALGWVELFDFQWLARPLRVETQAARRLHFKPIEKVTVGSSFWNAFWDTRLSRTEEVRVVKVERAGPEFDLLWEQVRDNAFVSGVHDRAWVQWRYLDAPGLNYAVRLAMRGQEPVGFAAWRVSESEGRRTGLVAQVETRRDVPDAWGAIWRAALAELRAAQVETVLTLAIPNSPNWHALRRVGFVPRHAFSLQMVPLEEGLPLEWLKEASSWNVVGGDFDVV